MTTKDYIISAIKTNRQTLKRLGIRNVGLFGSYSRDEQSVKSDIDILIDFTPEMVCKLCRVLQGTRHGLYDDLPDIRQGFVFCFSR